MNIEKEELLYDLLTAKAIYGLDGSDEKTLAEFDLNRLEAEFAALELTAAAISVAGCEIDEPLPAHLYSKILKSYEVSNEPATAALSETVAEPAGEAWPRAEREPVERSEGGAGWFGWLGWGLAAAASIALAVNVFNDRTPVQEVAKQEPPKQERVLSQAELRDQLIASGARVVKATWGTGNVKDIKEISGEVVWSDEKQTGYMTFRGLPVNDRTNEQYQLWIFEDAKLEAHPKDGGVFDISSEGEVIVPINAKLMTRAPKVFAITIEPPGGVVVSKREKIAALAKVETTSS
jgi:hypothetical protein